MTTKLTCLDRSISVVQGGDVCQPGRVRAALEVDQMRLHRNQLLGHQLQRTYVFSQQIRLSLREIFIDRVLSKKSRVGMHVALSVGKTGAK